MLKSIVPVLPFAAADLDESRVISNIFHIYYYSTLYSVWSSITKTDVLLILNLFLKFCTSE
jgi:hypothetical protein